MTLLNCSSLVISAFTSSSSFGFARNTTKRPALESVPGGSFHMYLDAGAVSALLFDWKIFGLHGFSAGIDAMQLVPGAGEA